MRDRSNAERRHYDTGPIRNMPTNEEIRQHIENKTPLIADGDFADLLAGDAAAITSRGAQRITAERNRQVTAEGWAPEHDAEHTHGELARVAIAYAQFDLPRPFSRGDSGGWVPGGWIFKPSDRIRNLERAGALIAAEIDRLLAGDVAASGEAGAAP